MLKKDFIAKLIEQIGKDIAKLLNLELQSDPEQFFSELEVLLKTNYQITIEQLSDLLESNDKRDVILFDENLKNPQINLFAAAGLAYLNEDEIKKAKECKEIIHRIKSHHRYLFEFPTVESNKTEEAVKQFMEELEKK